MGHYSAAVIGLGRIGLTYDFDPKREKPSSHTLAYQQHPQFDLAAAADTRREQEQALKQMVPRTVFYQNMEKLLQECSIDVISICTPPAQHLSEIQHILKTAKLKIIFCEKPLVGSVAEAIVLKQQIGFGGPLLIPNLSRRWNSGMRRISEQIENGRYGELQTMHIRYTRGIFNTGAHFFDLIRWWAGTIGQVQVLEKVRTSAERDGDPSFTFTFQTDKQVSGFAQAFDDEQYYLFEMDLYFSQGKIEIRNSGDDVFYYEVKEHHLFSGFKNLYLERQEQKLLSEANLGNAISHLAKVLDGIEQPVCTVDDGIYPLYVAEALLRSYNNHCSKERVDA
ncbi:hypothetical protein P22_0492 [Propionispora sp. 2/2-37]|uniref:Gfo/Idh/MocA family protein n=1 Tax=Propionispora sp. 2/2-37 TaxID=1677858 RepID=UPI0006BB66D4|nr:Gfo/Idh/MocA family oxidoreductase [Propionispora sp. 2/2-37]CUH94426.1 hypothetical protein P22_0492 [Propionispora sp. 2/2-37]